MFNKQQREVLGKLSETIWGTTSRWQKLYEAGALDVVLSETEVDEAVDKIQVKNSRKTRGTIYNRKTASEKVLKMIGDIPETLKVKKYDRARPQFEDVVATLTDLARATIYNYMKPEQLVNVFAVDFVAGEGLQINLVQKDDEQYKKDYEDLLGRVPGDVREKIEAFKSGISVDAIEFVSDVIFARTHHEHALELYNASLEEATAAHKETLRKARVKSRYGI